MLTLYTISNIIIIKCSFLLRSGFYIITKILFIIYLIILIELIICLTFIKHLVYFFISRKKLNWFLENNLKVEDEIMISSKEYKNFVNSLNKLVPFFYKMNLRDSKKRDIRINKYLIYRIKKK